MKSLLKIKGKTKVKVPKDVKVNKKAIKKG